MVRPLSRRRRAGDGGGVAASHLFRIAQESVTNAVKHGKAAHIGIRLKAGNGGRLTLTVTDDGRGLPSENSCRAGMGLGVMRYSADTIGATLDNRRRSAGGTIVECTLAEGG